MPPFKSLAKRQADQAKAREKLAELARKFVAKPVGNKLRPANYEAVPPAAATPPVPTRPQRPWAQVRAGSAPLTFLSRTANETIAPQPWAKELVSTLLVAADQGGVTLCLVWPAKLTALPCCTRSLTLNAFSLRTCVACEPCSSPAPTHAAPRSTACSPTAS